MRGREGGKERQGRWAGRREGVREVEGKGGRESERGRVIKWERGGGGRREGGREGGGGEMRS